MSRHIEFDAPEAEVEALETVMKQFPVGTHVHDKAKNIHLGYVVGHGFVDAADSRHYCPLVGLSGTQLVVAAVPEQLAVIEDGDTPAPVVAGDSTSFN